MQSVNHRAGTDGFGTAGKDRDRMASASALSLVDIAPRPADAEPAVRWCARCVLPDTRPNLVIGSDGVCNACQAHATKPAIDWDARGRELARVAANAKARAERTGAGYDCLVPVSGGKDSTWQVAECLKLGLTPLAVTWAPPSRTEIGRRNLENLISLGVDHIDYRINPKVEAKLLLRAYERFGATGIPMHLALFNIPLSIAVRFGIPLIVWGENSAFEYGTTDEALSGFKLDRAWLRRHGVTHGTTAADWVEGDLTAKELTAYFGPDDETLEANGVRAIFLGYYLEWDPKRIATAAKALGFQANDGQARTGLYDFADIDDDFISIHHWLKWYKFGFTRLFDNLSLEIRNGRLSRAEALETARQAGAAPPLADIETFCAFTGLSTGRFFEIAEGFRNRDIWYREAGTWKLRDFPIEGWAWS